MFVPTHFRWEGRDEIAAFIARHNFATLITGAGANTRVNHVPLLPDLDQARLDGHLARANPDAGRPGEREPALVVFNGPHAYVSPRWYASPDQVPTWNYLAVHIRGELEWLPPEAAPALLAELTAFHEDGQPRAWTMQQLPPARRERLMAAVVPLRIHVHEIQAKAKLGQNKPAADREAVADALGEHPLAQLMRNPPETGH